MDTSQEANASPNVATGPAGSGPQDEGFFEPSQNSQTASDFIDSQLQLEADAREALPYAFDHCTQPLGPLRQNLFSCLTCNPPPASPSDPFTPAAVCYSCSIACHGRHTLVELFNRRNFTCDCGTTRFPATSPCTLRIDPATGVKGPVHSQEPAAGNTYNQNCKNRFCGCGEVYNAEEEKGTMFQCLGLAGEEAGGCGEDWWHPECVVGLGRGWAKERRQAREEAIKQAGEGNDVDIEEDLPPGFPDEDDFDAFICYKCVDTTPWIKRYAGSKGFLPPVCKVRTDGEEIKTEQAAETKSPNAQHQATQAGTIHDEPKSEEPVKTETNGETNGTPEHKAPEPTSTNLPIISRKRSADEAELNDSDPSDSKKPKADLPYHTSLPTPRPTFFSLFCQDSFREHFCRCPECYPLLKHHPQLLEEEYSYEPPLSESGGENGESVGTGSLLDRGEAALSNVDRVRAIEGVMVYNHLKDKVKDFLQPFAKSGRPVGAEDIKAYFEKLRGDEQGIRDAKASGGGGEGGKGGEDGRREQSGY